MRNSKYKTCILDNLEHIETMISSEMQDKDIYKNLGITSSTWFKWKKEKTELIELYEKIARDKHSELPKKIEEHIQMKSIAENKLMEALENGLEWAIKYVLDTYEEHTPYHKVASIKLREREIATKEAQLEVDKNTENKPTQVVIVQGTPDE